MALPFQTDKNFAAERPGSLTLLAATGGTAPYTYSLSESFNQPLQNGLSFDPATRLLSVDVPEHEEWEGKVEGEDLFCREGGVACLQSTLRYRVTDHVGSTVTRDINYSLFDFPPGYLRARDDLSFTPDTAITPVTLRTVPGRSAAYTYALTGPNGADLNEVPGLTFDPATRVLSGTPTAEGTTTVTYSATNDLFTPHLVHEATFDITVAELAPPAQDDLVYNEGTAIDSVTLPAATGGTSPHTYALTGPNGADLSEVPGLTFDPATRVLSGTPTREGATTLTYTITDSAATPASVTHTFTVTVTEPISVAEVTDRTYAAGEALTLTLPEATGGASPHTYALTGPNGTDLSEVPGLTFDPATRVLSGTPTRAGATTLTYTVTDSATTPGRVTRTFTVTVTRPISVAEVDDQTGEAGEAFTLTLPAATDGTAPYSYAVTGPNGADLDDAVPGLTFDPATRVLSGAPTRAGATALTYTVTDSATTPGRVTRTFTVTGPISIAEVEDQTYEAGKDASLTLPEATGGTLPHAYTLTGPNGTDLSEVPGLTFDPATRVLSGAPTRVGATTLTYTATDSEDNATATTFTVTVTGPMFDAEVEDRTYAAGAAVSLTLPEASGVGVTYAVTGPNGTDLSEVPGLTFDPATRVLSGAPTRVGATTLTYTATDDYNNATATTFTVTVTGPMFDAEVEDRTYAAGAAVSLTLPEASGVGVTYAVTGPNGTDLSEVPGLTFDPATRVLSGAPTRVGATTLTYTATDDYNNATATTFTVTGPMFDAEVEDRTYAAGAAISLTLPEASGVGVTYAVTGPNGADLSEVPELIFDPATRILSGTPTRADTTTLSYTATDDWGNSTSTTFAVTVTGPMFDAGVDDQTYAVEEAIAPLTLPTATGAGVVTYALAGPDGAGLGEAVPGLTFDRSPGKRLLSGTPAEEGETTLTYTATDVYGNGTSTTFTVTVTGLIPAALNEVLLPEVVRGMADSTVGAIARRIGQAAQGAAATGFSLGGQRGWAALRSHGEALSEGRRDFRELLAGSDFVLNAAGASGVSSVALWGSGEYRGLSGESGTLGWDGELSGFHLGVDARPRQDLLTGVAVSWLGSDLDYEDAAAGGGLGAGAYAVKLTGVHPYLGWSAREGLEVWATAGYGEGELEVTPKGRESRSSDVETRTVGVGGSGLLLERGMSTVRLKGELMHSTLEVEDSVHIEGLEVEATRVRMTVEAGQTHALANGGVFEPSLEVGLRHDDGDGATGSGAEVGGGVNYRHPAWGITAGGRVRALVGHGGDQEEWGIEGHIRVSPGAGGQGLSLSLRPGYGDSGSGIRELWRQGVSEDGGSGAEDYRGRLEARLGYGLSVPGYAGVFTPYTGMTLGATEGYGIGVNWKVGSRFDLDLLGERREPGAGPAEHALLLKGAVRF